MAGCKMAVVGLLSAATRVAQRAPQAWSRSIVAVASLVLATLLSRDVLATQLDGAALYQQRCAMCHDQAQGRAPAKLFMLSLMPEYVEQVLTAGLMRPQATGLTRDQIRSLATHVTNREFGSFAPPDLQANVCKNPASPALPQPADWNGWGPGLGNTRYQAQPGLATQDVPRLKLKWAFAYPGNSTYGQPVLAGERLYLTTPAGEILSLDAASGCTVWHFDAGAALKAPITVGVVKSRVVAFVGDQRGAVFALDAQTGKLLWKVQADEHPLTLVTGAPRLHEGRLYVPVASQEELASGNRNYPCCTFRGSLVALEADTGKMLWKSYTIEATPHAIRKTPDGQDRYGPAGVGIWTSPVVDPKRGLLYVTTGNSYTDVSTPTSDAVMAIDMATGAHRWVMQALKDDNWTTGCWEAGSVNCPRKAGNDLDFASPPVLQTLADGTQVLLAGLKTGVVYAMDPDTGKVRWHTQTAGGILYGTAADAEHLYIAHSDVGGLSALKLKTGDIVWHSPPPKALCSWGESMCSAAQPSSIALIPGAAFAGSVDGHIRAYSTQDGRIIWDFDTAAQPHEAVNAAKASGGAVGGFPVIVANGRVYVNSGYSFNARGGNALLVFTVGGR